MAAKPSSKNLAAAFVADLTTAWQVLGGSSTAHRPYAFVLYGNEGAAELVPVLLTEEGLTRVAERYVRDTYYDAVDEARHALRYSVTDSPTFAAGAKVGLPTVRSLFAAQAQSLREADAYKVLIKSATEALRQVDAAGLFGAPRARGDLLLLIITEDTAVDPALESARALNPKPLAERFEHHFPKVEGEMTMCRAAAISADGRTLYAVTGRGGAEQVVEVVANDVAGSEFRRRWAARLPGGRDSGVVGLAVVPGEDLAYVVRRSGGSTTAAAFTGASGQPRFQAALDGDPKGLAVSADGSRVAALMFDGKLHVLDAELKTVRSHRFDLQLADAWFAAPGELLLATPDELLLISPETGERLGAWPFGASRVRMDARRTMLVLSHRLPQYGSDEPETSAGLFRWPDMELMHEIVVPGHHLATATLSPGGKHLAVELSPLARGASRVAVFDTETGAEVARRKVSLLSDILFVDERSVALAGNATTANVPVIRWRWPS